MEHDSLHEFPCVTDPGARSAALARLSGQRFVRLLHLIGADGRWRWAPFGPTGKGLVAHWRSDTARRNAVGFLPGDRPLLAISGLYVEFTEVLAGGTLQDWRLHLLRRRGAHAVDADFFADVWGVLQHHLNG